MIDLELLKNDGRHILDGVGVPIIIEKFVEQALIAIAELEMIKKDLEVKNGQ